MPRTGEEHDWLVALRDAVANLGHVLDRDDSADAGLGICGDAGSGTLAEAMGLVDRAHELLAVVKGRTLRAHESSDSWRRQGQRSPERARAALSRQGLSTASRELRQARDLATLPDAETALASGQITLKHAEALTGFLHGGNTQARKDTLETEETRLIEAARREDATMFARRLQRLGAQIDAQSIQDEHDRVRDRRFLRMTTRSGGMYGEFLLDKVAGAEFRAALDVHLKRPATDDLRTTEQRNADALIDMATMSSEAIAEQTGGRIRARVIMTIDAQTAVEARSLLTGQRASQTVCGSHTHEGHQAVTGIDVEDPVEDEGLFDLDPSPVHELAATAISPCDNESRDESDDGDSDAAEPTGRPPDHPNSPDRFTFDLNPARFTNPPPGAAGMAPTASPPPADFPPPADSPPRAPVAMLQGRIILPASEIARMLCDCDIGRAIIDAQGQPLDIGRASRTVPAAIRLALITRDQGCRHPGCQMPPAYTHAHHIVWWSRSGRTSIDNLILLCAHHHLHAIHTLGVTITRSPGAFHFHRTDGTLIGTTYDAGNPYAS